MNKIPSETVASNIFVKVFYVLLMEKTVTYKLRMVRELFSILTSNAFPSTNSDECLSGIFDSLAFAFSIIGPELSIPINFAGSGRCCAIACKVVPVEQPIS